jgi:hypothetical protein
MDPCTATRVIGLTNKGGVTLAVAQQCTMRRLGLVSSPTASSDQKLSCLYDRKKERR